MPVFFNFLKLKLATNLEICERIQYPFRMKYSIQITDFFYIYLHRAMVIISENSKLSNLRDINNHNPVKKQKYFKIFQNGY